MNVVKIRVFKIRVFTTDFRKVGGIRVALRGQRGGKHLFDIFDSRNHLLSTSVWNQVGYSVPSILKRLVDAAHCIFQQCLPRPGFVQAIKSLANEREAHCEWHNVCVCVCVFVCVEGVCQEHCEWQKAFAHRGLTHSPAQQQSTVGQHSWRWRSRRYSPAPLPQLPPRPCPRALHPP